MSIYREQELRSAVELLAGARDVTVLGHLNPDPDAFGSMVALGLALRQRGATVRVSFGSPDALPPSLAVLDPGEIYLPASQLPAEAPGLLVTVDCASLGRLDGLADLPKATVAAGGAVLVVDHHLSNTRFGTHHLVDVSAESTTVIVLRLIDALGVELTEPMARAVYAGLLTDTSSFRRAKPVTHEIAARLIAAGVDPDATGRALIGTHPFARLRMLAAVLGRTLFVTMVFTNPIIFTCTIAGDPWVISVSGPTGDKLGPAALKVTGSDPEVWVEPFGGTAISTLGIALVGPLTRSCGARTAAGLKVSAPRTSHTAYVALRHLVCTRRPSTRVYPVVAGS